MKSLKQRLKKHETPSASVEWNKYDERLLRAAESDDVDKVTAALKKGASPTKQDGEGRLAFHLAAGKGLINSLNIFLGHGVNLHATDPAGKTALHLSAGGGHSACVQRLLQCNSLVNSTDGQGRTALHDAASAGHSTIIKMLCDAGASVAAVDVEGRSPLMLAAQMSHPRACQQLLQCGAAINLRDKHNKTALTLACEHRGREVAEVLLKNRADATALDLHGHDPYHYACLSEDAVLISMVKQAWDSASKAKEAAKTAQKVQLQQRSANAEAEAHARKSSSHSPTKAPSSGVSWPSSGSVKLERPPPPHYPREFSGRVADGKDDPQNQHPESSQIRHHGPHSVSVRPGHRPAEAVSGEVEALRRELWEARRRLEGAEGEVRRLDAALVMRGREYEEMRRSGERALQEAHGRAWELEEALGEVQRRMAGSEARVRQMQAHLVAVRENLVEELRVQLHQSRSRGEAAVAELEQSRKELALSRREVQEQREKQGSLLQEVRRLSEEARSREEKTKALQASLASLETMRAETAYKETQTTSERPATSPKSTMTDLTSETLRHEMDKKGYITVEEHTTVKNSLNDALQEVQNRTQEALKGRRRAEDENQSLLKELQEQKRELDMLQEALQERFVPAALLEEKERELLQLSIALKKMEESKEREQTAGEAQGLRVEARKSCSVQPEEVSPDNRDPEGTRKQINKPPILAKDVNAVTGPDKDADVADETKAQRKAREDSSAASNTETLAHLDLQAHINNLQQQLENSERRYREVLAVYRTRLLHAAQGHMDEEARMALLQIAQMRQECVC